MDDLSGLKILITGANGFLGRQMIDRLRLYDVRVHAVSRNVPPCRDGAQWIQGDLTNGAWLRELVTGVKPDVIYQLASASLGGQDSEFVLPTFENDLRSTINTLLAAKACGTSRVILVASLEEPRHDSRTVSVPSPYAAAKAACTQYGLMFHQLYDVPVTILRLFMTYGPGQKSYKLIPYTISSLLKNQSPKLSSGIRPVDWVYVQDVITAFLAAAVRMQVVGTVVDIGSGCLVTVRDLVKEIHRQIPEAPAPTFGALPDRVMETVRCADTETALRTLDWKATTPISEGLSQTIAWYRAQVQGDAAVNT